MGAHRGHKRRQPSDAPCYYAGMSVAGPSRYDDPAIQPIEAFIGLRDAMELADCLQTGNGASGAPAIAAALSRYARARGIDRVLRIGFSGALAYGFDRGGWLADVPRGLGLTALQLVPPLKRELIRKLALI